MRRVVKYDLLRIAACLGVVLAHVAHSYWSCVDVNGRDFAVMTVYDSIPRFAVPVFFMLSGLFLLDPEREFQVRKWAARVGRLAAGFFIWSLFYAFQSVLFNGFVHGWGSVSREMWSDAVTRLVTGHGHMWFLLDLLGFYLLLPVLRKICEDIRVLGYFLLLWAAVRFVVVTLLPNVCGGLVLVAVTNMHLYLLTGYIGYFLGGYFLHKVDIPKAGRYVLYVLGAAAFVFTIAATIISCRESQSYNDQWFLPSNMNVLFFAAGMFVCFKYGRVPKGLEDSKWVPAMAKSAFFVYMIHPFFIEKLNLLGINVTSYPVALSIPVMTAGIFAVAMLLGWLAGKIPAVGKWVTFN